ncbi:MAG: hypothetical protein L6R19_16770 [Alphaproteobacteria bacterium]|nr:hypothetical protein [Alphaproteobacteria bacterium]
MDGFTVMPLADAVARSDFVVAVTGGKNVVDRRHFAVMKDGCVLANAGHFNVESDLAALRQLAVRTDRPRPSVEEFVLADGRASGPTTLADMSRGGNYV